MRAQVRRTALILSRWIALRCGHQPTDSRFFSLFYQPHSGPALTPWPGSHHVHGTHHSCWAKPAPAAEKPDQSQIAAALLAADCERSNRHCEVSRFTSSHQLLGYPVVDAELFGTQTNTPAATNQRILSQWVDRYGAREATPSPRCACHA